MEENIENNISRIKEENSRITDELERDIAKLRDPTVHAAIIYTAVRERENTNLILKNINARLEALDQRLKQFEADKKVQERPLAEVDRSIVEFVKANGPVCAEAVQQHFKYRGRNGACARLNRLYEMGVLKKQRTGKKIYYDAQ